MDRRHFLSALTALSVGLVLDPERLGWVKTKTIFLPSPRPAPIFDLPLQTPKYQFGRLASTYPPTPAGLRALMRDPRFTTAFPAVRLTSDSTLDFGDGRLVDVLVTHG